MGNGEVRREDRHGIAEDQVFVAVENPLLTFKQAIQAEETLLLLTIFFCHIGRTAFDPFGIILETDSKSLAG